MTILVWVGMLRWPFRSRTGQARTGRTDTTVTRLGRTSSYQVTRARPVACTTRGPTGWADSSPEDTKVRSVPSQIRQQDQPHDEGPPHLHWAGQGRSASLCGAGVHSNLTGVSNPRLRGRRIFPPGINLRPFAVPGELSKNLRRVLHRFFPADPARCKAHGVIVGSGHLAMRLAAREATTGPLISSAVILPVRATRVRYRTVKHRP
jgi:hypothetical protein